MAFDAHANFGYSTVQSPAPGLLGTSLIVAAGQGALFPAAPFNCTVWPSGVLPLASNAEIVRVTAVVGDTLTIVRAQEGSSIVNITTGFQIANTTSVKVFTDIEDAVVVSAGTTKATGPFAFANSNGVSFGIDTNGLITASVDSGGGTAGVAFSAGTSSSQGTGPLVFADANNIVFGMDNGTITANAIIPGFIPGFSAQLGSSTYPSVLTFVAGNGLTFINSNGSVAASYTVPNTAGLISFINVSGGTTSNNLSAITFSNSNGITFGLNGSVMTASHNALTSQSNQAVSASNGSFAFQTLSFTNAFNVTFGTSAGGIIFASVATAAAGNSINVSAGTQSSNLGTLVFSNSNGMVFGLSNGTITASNTNALTSQSNQAASASNGSFTFQTIGFSNANGITFGTSAGSIITASHNGITAQSTQPVAASASNGSFNFSTLAFSNANGVTFGTSAGSIITASVDAAAGGVTLSEFYPYGPMAIQVGAPAMATASVMNFNVPQNLSFSYMVFAYSQTVNTAGNNSSAGVNLTATLVLLTASAGTLKSVASTTYSTGQTWSSNTTGSATGGILVPVPWATSITPGNYYLAFNMSTANTGGVLTGAATTALGNTMSLYGAGTQFNGFVNVAFRNIGGNSATSLGFLSAVGLNTVTSNLTQIDATNIRCDQSAQRAHIAVRFCTAT